GHVTGVQTCALPILKWIPAHITFDRFAELTFGSGADENAEGFRAALVNSSIIASAVTALSLVVGTPAAYAFARLRFPGRGWLIRSEERRVGKGGGAR